MLKEVHVAFKFRLGLLAPLLALILCGVSPRSALSIVELGFASAAFPPMVIVGAIVGGGSVRRLLRITLQRKRMTKN
ncbi:hypothetical protein MUP77_24065 [Candidatus Bathyarchaeota archaeon]|nr:hypothetical protein [Candidatus Bathyarchaeota archaeon]